MPIFWNDIEILQVIDESERENSTVSSGTSLMQAVAARYETIASLDDYGSFVRELLLARDAGFLSYAG
jgi:hypothetical protein